MNGDKVIARGDIVITDNRITAIGASGKVQIPAGAVVRNLSGQTIIPGLVDIHAHTWVAWSVHRSQVSQFLAQLAYADLDRQLRRTNPPAPLPDELSGHL